MKLKIKPFTSLTTISVISLIISLIISLVILSSYLVKSSTIPVSVVEKFTPEEYIHKNLKKDTTYLDYLKMLSEAKNTSYELIEESYYNLFISKIKSGNFKIEDIKNNLN